MTARRWPTKLMSVTSLHLDSKNPRLGRERASRAPREIIQYLFDNDKALDVAESVATRGYFPNEPLLAIKEDGRYVIVEGNRRLAAVKALREPGLVEGPVRRQLERLSRSLAVESLSTVPVTVAPTRKSTDRQIVGRHIGSPVLSWQAENRASFILDKLDEGYDNDALRDELGFTLQDIQKARQTRAIADMARSLDLPEEVAGKLENPRAKLFTTLERVFDSTVGRKYLLVETDADHGLRGTTTRKEFVRGFSKLVTDVALGHETSRTLNKNEDMERYFQSWNEKERVKKKRGSFVPDDVTQGRTRSRSTPAKTKRPKKSKQVCKTVLPRDLKVRYGSDRLLDIRNELVRLKRHDFPNAGAVLLRVFFELTVFDYFERTSKLQQVEAKLAKKGKLGSGMLTLKHLLPDAIKHAKERLSSTEANKVEKALRYDSAAPFTISDLHAFVHQAADLPGERDIWQFWLRTEPLLRLMLERDPDEKVS